MESLRHVFVDSVPERLAPGLLYVSLEHATMLHLCACGCDSEVVTPLSPTDWKLTFDGRSISVSPSVGSWNLPCRSHYVIANGRILWADAWTDYEVERGRRRDRQRKAAEHGDAVNPVVPPSPISVDENAVRFRPANPLVRLARWLIR